MKTTYQIIASVSKTTSSSFNIKNTAVSTSLSLAKKEMIIMAGEALKLIVYDSYAAVYISIHENGVKLIKEMRITNE